MYLLYDNAALPALSSLIRISADHRIFAPPRSFSQLVTSFFGAMYQGILRMLFVAWSLFRTLSRTSYSSLRYKKFYNFNSTNSISTVSKPNKIVRFLNRINQNQSVNCLLYFIFFSMQLSIFVYLLKQIFKHFLLICLATSTTAFTSYQNIV